jgi:hypothetical protein
MAVFACDSAVCTLPVTSLRSGDDEAGESVGAGWEEVFHVIAGEEPVILGNDSDRF